MTKHPMLLNSAKRLAVVLMLLLPVATHAQFRERVDVIAVEVPIEVRDRAGNVPADLTKDDFEVFEDGVRQEVIGLTYPSARAAERTPSSSPSTMEAEPSRRWKIVIFLQQWLSTTPGLRKGLQGILDQSEKLTELGDVEIATDFPSPRRILAATSDEGLLRKTLGDLQRKAIGREEQARLRRTFLHDVANVRLSPRTKVYLATSSAQQEASLIRRRQEAILSWMTLYGAESDVPRLMILVTDGYALDPIKFYGRELGANLGERSDMVSMSAGPRQFDLARTIAAQGWTVYSIAAGALHQLRDQEMMEMTYEDVEQNRVAPPSADKLAPMFMLSSETGGKLATDISRIGRDIESFAGRLTLTYRARRERDGVLRRLKIRSLRPGVSVTHPQSVTSEPPDKVAAVRATALALDIGERGELPVTCSIRNDPSTRDETLVIRIDLTAFGAARASMTSATVRVAVGVAADKKLPFRGAQSFEKLDFSSKSGYEFFIPLRKRGEGRTAVVVEEVSTGAWGGSVCD